MHNAGCTEMWKLQEINISWGHFPTSLTKNTHSLQQHWQPLPGHLFPSPHLVYDVQTVLDLANL